MVMGIIAAWCNNGNKEMPTETGDVFRSYLQRIECKQGIIPTDSCYRMLTPVMAVYSSEAVYKKISAALGLESPYIHIMGWEKAGQSLLVELYAEDRTHLGMYLLAVDTNGEANDYLYLEQPVDGDQQYDTDKGSLEWDYMATFLYQNDTVWENRCLVDVLVTDETIDTLKKKILRKAYQIDSTGRFNIIKEVKGN